MANETEFSEEVIQSIRDKTVAALADINRSLEAFNAKAKATSTIGGGLNMMGSTLASIGRTLTGGALAGAGIVAGLRQVSNELDAVAAKSLTFQNFARDISLSTSAISQLRQGFARTGVDTAEADRNISSMMGKLKEMQAYRAQSSLAQQLRATPGDGPAIADRLQALVDAGKLEEAQRFILEGYKNQTSPASRYHHSQTFGMPESAFQTLPEAMRNNVQGGTSIDPKAADEFRNRSVDFEERMKSWKNRIYNWGIGTSNEIDAMVDRYMGRSAYREDDHKNNAVVPGTDPMADHNTRSMYGDYWRNKNSGAFSPEALRRWGDNPRGITDFGGMRRTVDLEEDQASSLRDIRDTLQRMEGKSGTTFGSDYGTGTRSDGALNASGGGFRPGQAIRDAIRGSNGNDGSTPGVGAERGKVPAGGDPRGMEAHIRETAKKYGIDPDTAVAVAKSEGLLSFQSTVRSARGPNGREDSWGAFQLYKGGGLGNEFQKETGLDPADPANEKATIDFALKYAAKHGWTKFHGAANTGISKWAGISPAPGSNSDGQSPYSGMSFGGDVRERQSKVAGVRRGALDPRLRTALDYASWKTGLTVDVTSGGQRMHGAPGAIGSHRHDNGNAADFNLRDENGNVVSPNDPRALEFYRYAAQPPGGVRGGSHSYMSDPNKIHLDRVGSIYGGGKAFREAIERGRQEQEEFRRSARERMDKAASGGAFAKGAVNAEVKFLNVPPGVETKAQMDGDIFRELSISKTRQAGTFDDAPGRYGSY